MIRGLSSLQKKLSLGIEELKGFVQNHRDLLHDEGSAHGRESLGVQTGDWHKSRRRLAELDTLANELESHERSTQQGSAELYWQSRVNSLTRARVLQFLRIKETEYLRRGTVEIGKKIQALIPTAKLEAMLSNELTEGEILKLWANVSDRNLKLLEKLKQVEDEYTHAKSQSEYWNLAFENAYAAVCLVQLEEAFLSGNLKGFVSYDDAILEQGFTLERLAKLQKESHRLEADLAEIGHDAHVVGQMLDAVDEDQTIPPRYSETKLILQKCIEIVQKYQSQPGRPADCS